MQQTLRLSVTFLQRAVHPPHRAYCLGKLQSGRQILTGQRKAVGVSLEGSQSPRILERVIVFAEMGRHVLCHTLHLPVLNKVGNVVYLGWDADSDHCETSEFAHRNPITYRFSFTNDLHARLLLILLPSKNPKPS
jgi:hypothetical protein